MKREPAASIDQDPLTGAARRSWEESLLAKAGTGGRNHMLQTLFRFANGKADLFPSESAIAEKSGKSDRTVRRTLKELQASGLIVSVEDKSIRVQRRIVFPSHPNAAAVLGQFPKYMQGGQIDQNPRTCRGDKNGTCRGDKNGTCRGDKMAPEYVMGNRRMENESSSPTPPPNTVGSLPSTPAGLRSGVEGGVKSSCRVIGCPGGEECELAMDKAEWHERLRRWEKGGRVGPKPKWTSHRAVPEDVESTLEDDDDLGPAPPRWSGPACDGQTCCENCPDCWDRMWGDGEPLEHPPWFSAWLDETESLVRVERSLIERVAAPHQHDEQGLREVLEWLRSRRRKPRLPDAVIVVLERAGRL